MDLRRRGLLVIAKMALQDGVIAREEWETLEDMGGGLRRGELEGLVREAQERPLDELLRGIESYEDRFVIALRAYHMAHSDSSFDIEEEMSFDLLVERFGITDDDRALIERVEAGMSGRGPFVSEPRLLELHRGSSFFVGG